MVTETGPSSKDNTLQRRAKDVNPIVGSTKEIECNVKGIIFFHVTKQTVMIALINKAL